MKILKLPFFTILIIALSAAGINAQVPEAGKKEVKVFFMFIGPDGSESEIRPLKRKVSSAAPLFPAMAALLVEPTGEEADLGYTSAGYGDMTLKSVKLTKGVARVDFVREIRDDYNPGDLQTLYFEDAVIRTAKQFPSVKKVMVCVNGINEFGIGMVEGRPYNCPKVK